MSDDRVIEFGDFAGRPPEPRFVHTLGTRFSDGAPQMVSKGYLATPRGTCYARCESPCHTHADLDAQRAYHEDYLLRQMTRER